MAIPVELWPPKWHKMGFKPYGDERPMSRLNKALYGHPEAGGHWERNLDTALKALGAIPMKEHKSSYWFPDSQQLLAVYVDDLLVITNNTSYRDELQSFLLKRFPMKCKDELHWFLHVKVDRSMEHKLIFLSQQLYVEELVQKFGSHLDGISRSYSTPMSATDDFENAHGPLYESDEWHAMAQYRFTYMTLLGAFQWLCSCTRPDIQTATAKLAQHLSNSQTTSAEST